LGGGQARVRLQGRNSVPEVFLFFVSPMGFPWMDPLVVNGSVCAWSHPKEPEEGLCGRRFLQLTDRAIRGPML